MKVRKIPTMVRAIRFDRGGKVPLGVYRTHSGYVCRTIEGAHDIADGDWVVYGAQGEPYPVPDEKFRALYEHVTDDQYRSLPQERDAIMMPNAFTIHCSGGDLRGEALDWLMLATPDDAYPVAADIFAKTYRIVPSICGVISHSGPNGEPLACAYAPGHDGPHSWASLPTFANGKPVPVGTVTITIADAEPVKAAIAAGVAVLELADRDGVVSRQARPMVDLYCALEPFGVR